MADKRKSEPEVVGMGLMWIRVCSALSEEDTLLWTRENSPAGSTENWQKTTLKEQQPVTCAGDDKKKHYMFIC
jgi:hypothetical protein